MCDDECQPGHYAAFHLLPDPDVVDVVTPFGIRCSKGGFADLRCDICPGSQVDVVLILDTTNSFYGSQGGKPRK